MSAVKEGELLWTPSAQRVARANLTHYMAWLAERGYVVTVPGVGMVVTPHDRWAQDG